MRNPRRTASTASALMIGLGLVAMVSILAASLKASFDAALEDTLRADLVLDVVLVPRRSARKWRRGSRASTVSRPSRRSGRAGSRSTTATPFHDRRGSGDDRDRGEPRDRATEPSRPSTDGDVARLRPDDGRTTDGRWATTLPSAFATIGDDAAHDRRDLRREQVGGRLRGLARHVRASSSAQQLDTFVFVKVADGADVAAVPRRRRAGHGRVRQHRGAGPGRVPRAAGGLHRTSCSGLVTALLFLAILIALFGIVNTLGLSIFERTRELGLLRAVGMSRTQVKRMIRWESVIIAILGRGARRR